MRNIVLLSVILTLATGLCFAEDTIRFHSRRSDLVVIGKFTTVSESPIRLERGMVGYSCKFRIADVLKGDISLKGKTIVVGINRPEMSEKDKHPLLKKDSECILFLKKVPKKENWVWGTTDHWFSIQYPSPSMARSLKRLAKETTDKITAMPANQSIPCTFIADVTSIVPVKPGTIKGYVIDKDPKWTVELKVLSNKKQKVPFQPGIRRCYITDVGKVFGSARKDVAGTYQFKYTWNVRVPGKPKFENFKAMKGDLGG